LRAQDEEMKERDTEINRLLGELRRCQTQLLRLQVQNDIMIPFRLRLLHAMSCIIGGAFTMEKETTCKTGKLDLDIKLVAVQYCY
jgi:hypothetical protein